MSVKTRFAPSPTGHLHIGNARTALFNWLFARHNGGSFILRIEDTDTQRSERRYETSIMEDLLWLGLGWDEGPDKESPYIQSERTESTGETETVLNITGGPYRQSERTGMHMLLAQWLINEGRAYRCWCTRERLEELKKSQTASGMPPRYDGRCRGIKDAPPGVAPAIRFIVPDETVAFLDGAHGPMTFATSSFGDFVIIGSDGVASYNFAVVADDAMMGVTHIIRGEDHLSNTPRQLLLFKALGFAPPSFTHIPLVLSQDKTPLSKRDGTGSIKALREAGYLPEAVINAMARLGWSFGDSFLGLSEMTSIFTGEGLSKSPSVFDMAMLNACNKTALERLGADGILNIIHGRKAIEGLCVDGARAVEAVRPGASTIVEIERLLEPFTNGYQLTGEAIGLLREPHAGAVIDAFAEGLEKTDEIDEASYKRLIEETKLLTGEKGKRLFMPLRAALTGRTEGIELPSVIRLLGVRRSVERLKRHSQSKKTDERG